MGMTANQNTRTSSSSGAARSLSPAQKRGSLARGGKGGGGGKTDALRDTAYKEGQEFFGEKGSAEEDALGKLPGILARLLQQRPATPTLQGLPEGGSPQGVLQALAAQGQQQISQGRSNFNLLKGAKK